MMPGSDCAQQGDAVIRLSESFNGSSDQNASALQFNIHEANAHAPKVITIGKGYYANNPISYDSQFGHETWIKNSATGAFMNHEVGSAAGLNQTLVMSAKDSRQQNENGIFGESGVQMKIAEDVRDGKVSIDVIQGDVHSSGQAPSTTAWKDPSVEIEEEYIGSFHIEKNMSIQVPIARIGQNYSWLPCCQTGYLDIPEYIGRYPNAKAIFDYDQ